ncbi:MAG TPA: hypothetical protein ENJ32_04935 [Crenotrichaceae bacterium]|nr:hypothetical protein [Crenotrichaceae bacterium]
MIDFKQCCLMKNSGLFLTMAICVVPQIKAVESSDTAIDCSTAKINFVENPEWTYQERLEAMNKAFYESVERYALCQSSIQSSGGASSASANTSSQASGDGDQAGATSVASPSITGTEAKTRTQSASSESDDSVLTDKSGKQPVASKQAVTPNGKTPEDIPGADNDDVIAAQIRLAAEIETDPDKKAKLWNEYRKYKGLPTR